MINSRCIEILKLVIAQDQVKPGDLATSFNVTYRTILSDLNTIDEFLKEHWFNPLIRSKTKGLLHTLSAVDCERLSDLIRSLQPYDYFMSKDERKMRIVLQLFKTDNPITLEKLAETLMVSRTTIVKDLSSVEEWLLQKHMKLVKKTNRGVYVEGEERFKRRAVMELLLADANKDNIAKLVKDFSLTLSELNPEIASMIGDLFDAKKVEFLKMSVHQLEKQLDIQFTDISFSTLIIHIGVTIERLKTGNIGDYVVPDATGLQKLREFDVVSEMCDDIATYFGIAFPEPEVVNMMLYILCTSIHRDARQEQSAASLRPIEVICHDLILQVELSLGYKFGGFEKLFNDLLLHLIPTIHRVQFDMQLIDPFAADIQKKYANLFACVKRACLSIDSFTGKKIIDEEIAYITLHFCAAVERQMNNQSHKIRVVTVCSSGIGTARILESRLRSQFPNLEIVETLSYQAFLQRTMLDIDLIVSTIYLDQTPIPYLQVNPLLTEEDCANLNALLDSKSSSSSDQRLKYDHVMEIVAKHCLITDEKGLRAELQSLFQLQLHLESEDVPINEDEPAQEMPDRAPSLSELLTTGTIKLQASYSDWRGAVREGANMLLEQNVILPRYVDALLKSCERTGPLGPYCVISPAIAMPHAKPSDGVIKTCMSLITLYKPISFGHNKFDPVRLIIIFASSDGHNHLPALKELTGILMDKDKLERLLQTYRIETALELIKSVKDETF
ncbi:BglG family transcription antiterminator [Paenibacillus sp. GSMTC-2017]|uniref:BglG family transcription antiterminator n=1 Tax=Paenibacillus sp. GSMTC-2017 TaxID=2794350 RepID=UPI0018DA32A1|nr:BglG family transcription antiterminator [Paenibacillus sp. GSMTC-2017]MBH5320696.1 BglG family transcription antiterminator [Paenibacillus sp. GSMTC-2017]